MRTLKVKSISVMLVFTLLMTVFMPLTVFATAREDLRVIPAHDWTDGNFDMSLSSTGVLTWEQQSGATGFKVWINDFVSLEHGRRLSGYIDVATASYNIIDLMDSLKLESGKYEVVVSQTGAYVGSELNPQNQESMLVTYISAYDELEAPTNVTWSGNRVTWDAVPNATGYTYKYYNSTGAYVGTSNTSNTQTVALSSSEDGWYVKVKATASGYRDSQWKESPLKGPVEISELNATITIPTAGATPGDLTLTSGDSSKYTISSHYWKLNDSGSALDESSTQFEAGQTYTLYLSFSSEDGYEISDDATFTVNGESTDWTGFEAKTNRKINFTIPALAVTTYTVTYDANGGTGSMADATGVSGEYTLLANGFTAPEGYQFKAWAIVNGNVEQKQPGEQITITADTYIYAIWEEIPDSWNINVTKTGVYNITPSKTLSGFNKDSITVLDKNGKVVKFNEAKQGWPLVAGQSYTIKLNGEFDNTDDLSWNLTKRADTIFSDTASGENGGWYNDAVIYSVGAGLITGYGGTDKFGTADNIQRQDFVVILARLAGVDLDNYVSSGNYSFADVPSGAYYEKAIMWAADCGITTGYAGGTKFGVGDKITREQLVTFLYRYAKYANGGIAPAVSADAEQKAKTYADYNGVSDYAKEAVIWALDKGVIKGQGGTHIAPAGNALRCEIAQIMYNIFLNDIF